jgi:chromate transporter
MAEPAMASQPTPSIAELFFSFFRLGLTAFGGPSMIAYIRKMAVEKKNWLDSKTFNSGVALCQSIPGATAMQTSAYVGLKTRGVIGALASFGGFALPAFVLMMTLASLYAGTHNLPVVLSAFSGLQAIIVAIVANASVSFGKTTLKNWNSIAVAAAAAVLFGFNINPLIVIIVAAAAGLVFIHPAQPVAINPVSSPHSRTNTRPALLILSAAAIGLLLLFVFNRTLFDLAVLMIRIDLFAFGGGFASIPLMLHEIVEVRHWLDAQTFMNGIVLGQVTPGPIVITATFVGYIIGGLPGGLAATFGIFLPSFLMVVIISPYFERLRVSTNFNKATAGVLCSFVGLLITVTFRFALNVHWDLPHTLLAGSALTALLLKVDILWVVFAGTIISLIIFK